MAELQHKIFKIDGKIRGLSKTMDPEELKKIEEEAADLLDRLYRKVGDVCVDPSLNFEYWKRGEGFNVDVPFRILAEVLRLSGEAQKEIVFFRKK